MMLCEGIKKIKSCNVNKSWGRCCSTLDDFGAAMFPFNFHFYLVFVFSSKKVSKSSELDRPDWHTHL